jgi:beta-glucosidase
MGARPARTIPAMPQLSDGARAPLPFLWGVATSSHQIEGGNENNDWREWEATPGKVRDGVISGSACMSWERWEEDLKLIRHLGLNAYRFSLEWSRIEPEEGRIDRKSLKRYRAMLEGCRDRGITPMLTLHHFTNPRWFASRGGWEERSNLPLFERYARLAGETFGDLVDHWITINEPEVLGFYGYDAGIFPPGVRDRSRALAVIANLLEAHGLACHALKEADRTDLDGDGIAALVGAAKHWALLEPRAWWSSFDRFAAWAQHRVFNVAVARALTGGPIDLRIPGARSVRRAPEVLRGAADFLGVNYYTRWRVALFRKEFLSVRPGAPMSDLEWEIYPEGLERALRACAGFGLPLYVTENGIADQTDRYRPEFIRRSLSSLDRARAEGLDVRGYFHWSLMDNFEWADGYRGRFGLYATDFSNLQCPRVERSSALVYATEVARRSEIPSGESGSIEPRGHVHSMPQE